MIGGAAIGGGVAGAATPTPSVYNSGSGSQIYTTGTYIPYNGNAHVSLGGIHQQGYNWGFQLNNTFAPGEQIAITVGDGSTANSGVAHCVSGTDYVAFDQTPIVDVNSLDYGTTAPNIQRTLTTAAGDPASCAGVKDELILTITNSAIGPIGATQAFDVSIDNVFYSLGTANKVDGSGNWIGVAATDTPATAAPTSEVIDSNAYQEPFSTTTDSPRVGLQDGTTGAISPVTVAETSGDNFAAGLGGTGTGGQEELCVEDGNSWNGTTTITATGTQVSNQPAGTFSNSITVSPQAGQNGGSCYIFYVLPTSSSTTTPASLTTGTLNVNTDAFPGQQVIHMYDDQSGQAINSTGFSIVAADRIAGATADDTAIASMNSAFSANGDNLCRTDGLASIVLTNDSEPYDSLSANFLAANLNTGVLITPQGSLPTNLVNLIRNDGIGTVYIVGGTGVVSQGIQNTLNGTQAYYEGGTTPATNSTANGPAPVNIRTVRIAGATADNTSSQVDQYLGYYAADSIWSTPGAYNNNYNDTTGGESAAPSPVGSLRTVIVTTDANYQDALSAASVSYGDYLPIVLTPGGSLSADAMNTIANLGTQQAIVMGGPFAISGNVVSQLEALNLSVLRIAGDTFGDTASQMAKFILNEYDANGVANGLGNSFCGISAFGSARGDLFSDALTSAEVLSGSPLLLSNDPSTLDPAEAALLTQGGSFDGIGSQHVNFDFVDVFGGVGAQTPALINSEIQDVAGGVA